LTSSDHHQDKPIGVLVGEALGLLQGLDKRQDTQDRAIQEVCEEVSGVRKELQEMNGSIRDTKVRVKSAEAYSAEHAKFHAMNVPIATRRQAARGLAWVGAIATAGGAVAGAIVAIGQALHS
jgi:peptidoglycan hydrolase CwlO-like protein